MAHQIALATKHGKLDQIAPAFLAIPDFELVLAEIDTDRFGTFSGDIPRTHSPKDGAFAAEKHYALCRTPGCEDRIPLPRLQRDWVGQDRIRIRFAMYRLLRTG